MVGKARWPDQVVFDGGSMRQFAHFLMDQEAERDECWPLEVFLFFFFLFFPESLPVEWGKHFLSVNSL